MTLLVVFAAPPVRGQPAAPAVTAQAQALFKQAAAEMDAGNFASACKKLEEVTRLVPEAIGGKENLGECYEKQGKLASAWAQYTAAAGLATRAGQAERARTASKSAAALQPRLAMLTIRVPDELGKTPGIAVTRDGVAVAEAQWGTAAAVDPGAHEIVATAPDRTPFRKVIEIVKEGAGETVVIGPLVAVQVAAPPIPPAAVVAVAPKRAWQVPVGLAAGGVGLAGIVAGAVLGGLAIARNDASKAGGHCNASSACDDTGYALRTEALGLGSASTGAVVAGGILLAGGAALVLTAPRAPRPVVGEKVAVSLHLAGTGLSLQGRW